MIHFDDFSGISREIAVKTPLGFSFPISSSPEYSHQVDYSDAPAYSTNGVIGVSGDKVLQPTGMSKRIVVQKGDDITVACISPMCATRSCGHSRFRCASTKHWGNL
jgi:hypothetical protein